MNVTLRGNAALDAADVKKTAPERKKTEFSEL
jgi:hypothetical protein